MCPWYDLMRIAIFLCFITKTYDQTNHKKKFGQMPIKQILQNTWLIFLKTGQVTNNKESLRNCHNQEHLKKTWWLNAM